VAAVVIRPRELVARFRIVRISLQAQPQLSAQAFEMAGTEVGDLQVALGDLHAWIDLERVLEMTHRLVVQALVVEDDAEVVVRTRILRVDAARERAQDLQVTFGARRCSTVPADVAAVGPRHGGGSGRCRLRTHQPSFISLSMICSDVASGMSRKWPRIRSSPMIMPVFTQSTWSCSSPKFR